MTAATQSTPRSVFAMRDQVDILIVDDRPENLLALEAILEPLGQRLVQAHSGEEALRKLLKHDFAVVLLDVQMPGMNGFETAQLIKSRERTRYIPIIFLTAISKEEDYVFRGYQVGAVDYISKPSRSPNSATPNGARRSCATWARCSSPRPASARSSAPPWTRS
jgi:CheY-like chemotaxis protein